MHWYLIYDNILNSILRLSQESYLAKELLDYTTDGMLRDEGRYTHIVENHNELAGYYDDVLEAIENPDYVIKGYEGALITLRSKEGAKFLAAIYKETGVDGFVITGFLYISFKRPQRTTDSEMLENGVRLRYKGSELVGITVIDASKGIAAALFRYVSGWQENQTDYLFDFI